MKLALPLILTASLLAHAIDPATTNQLESVTLEQALETAERLHPQLALAHAQVDAAAGRVEQAGTLSNPEAIFGAQQLPLDTGASNQREYVAGIGQAIPLGGRLSRARQAEHLEREVHIRGLEVTRRELRRRVHSAFATALYQERAFQTVNQIQQSVEQAVATTKARMDAGDVVPQEVARLEIESARAGVEMRRSQAMREQAMIALGAAMGDASCVVRSVAGSLDATFEIPALESLASNLALQPETKLAEADLLAKRAQIELARAERIPDVKVEALYHRLEATQENTFDLGLSIPLPLFNRNRGRVREARAEVAAAEAKSRLTENELNQRLRESYSKLTGAIANARTIKTEILPRAEAVLKTSELRYEAGDTSFADLLPVRRDWSLIQMSYLESLRDVIQAWGELQRFSR